MCNGQSTAHIVSYVYKQKYIIKSVTFLAATIDAATANNLYKLKISNPVAILFYGFIPELFYRHSPHTFCTS